MSSNGKNGSYRAASIFALVCGVIAVLFELVARNYIVAAIFALLCAGWIWDIRRRK